jgi:hypothetical protein
MALLASQDTLQSEEFWPGKAFLQAARQNEKQGDWPLMTSGVFAEKYVCRREVFFKEVLHFPTGVFAAASKLGTVLTHTL